MSNWYFKISAYNYPEDLLRNIAEIIPSVRDPKRQAGLVAAYKNLNLNRNDQGSLYQAARLLRLEKVTDPSEKGGWYKWETGGDVLQRISLLTSNSEDEPPTVQLQGLKFGNSQTAQYIQQQMGSWMGTEEIPTEDRMNPLHNVWVRGTQEAWGKFVQLSSLWLEHHEVLGKAKFRSSLPSEAAFTPGYAAEPEAEMNKILEVYSLNDPSNPASQPSYVPKSKKEPMTTPPGIRLVFSKKDKLFPDIRDIVVKQQFGKRGPARAEFDPKAIRINWDNNSIDIFSNDPGKWAILSKKLQFLGYPTKESGLNDLIASFTGQAIGETYQQKAKKDVGTGPSDRVIQGRLRKNVLESPTVGDRFGVAGPISQDQFDTVLERNYPEAFKTPESQQIAQKQGIYFAATRNASLLADEPGSGKTMQAVVAADVVRNEGQKVLVITPSMLIRENWIANIPTEDGGQRAVAKAPGQFAGHGPETIRVCTTAQDFSAAVNDPQVIWVVLPIHAFSQRGQKSEDLVNAIASAEKTGIFASLIFDEIQTVKNPNSNTFKKMANAVSAYHIPHRIGLTGTPSDDNPNSIYSQLLLLRHPVLFEDKGTQNWVLFKKFRNSKGFADTFLGGPKLSTGVTVSKEDRAMMTEDELEEEYSDLWREKAQEVIKWVESLTSSRKLQILDLFSSTYLRRNKEDIREDMPPLERNVVNLPLPFDVVLPEESQNWHTSLLKEMAHRKAPYTIQQASRYLQDPTQKLFIVTKHPAIADEIAGGINQLAGEGTAASVHQETSGDMRTLIAETFRAQNGVLPQNKNPLRAVVYTMELGAVGLNFAIANRAIFNDMDWNPSDNLQAEYRVHRIDSPDPVNVDYMVFENSYDEEMYNRVEKKQYINDHVSDLIKSAAGAADPQQKLVIADQFIRFLVDSILLDVGMKPEDQSKFEQQLNVALATEPGAVQRPQIAASGNWYHRLKYELVQNSTIDSTDTR